MSTQNQKTASQARTILAAVMAVAGLAVATPAVRGQTFWDSGGGANNDWSNAANWDSVFASDLEPAIFDTAVINNGGVVVITQAGEQAGGVIIGQAADTGLNANNTGLGGTLNFNGGDLTTGSIIPAVGIGMAAGTGGTWNHNAGKLTTGESFIVAVAPGSTGTFNMTGGILDISTGDADGFDFFAIGDNGSGTGSLANGALTVRGNFMIAIQPTATGVFTMNSGSIALTDGAADFVVGFLGNGTRSGTGAVTSYGATFNHAGGTVTTIDNYTVAAAANAEQGRSSGIVNQSGSSSLVDTNIMIVGEAGDGVYNLSGGTLAPRNFMVLGIQSQAVGTVTQSGASVVNTPGLIVAETGRGTYTINGGTLNVLGNDLPLNEFGSSFGNLIVGRDGFRPAGFVGEGTFNQAGGNVTVGTAARPRGIFLGDFNDSRGTYVISGGTLVVHGNFNVGGALASNAPTDDVRTGDQGQAENASGILVVRGSAASVTVHGDFRANPADMTRPGLRNSSTLVFELLNSSGTSLIDVIGQADLDGAVVNMSLTGGYRPAYNSIFNLITAQQFGNTGTGTTLATGTGEGYTLAAEDVADWTLRIVSGGRGEILQAIYSLLRGDANHDRTVNFDDLLVLAQNYGSSPRTYEQGDFNDDGKVNFDDLLLLAQNYGQNSTPPPASLFSPEFASDWALAQSLVPEPSSALLALAAAPLVRRRRRIRA